MATRLEGSFGTEGTAGALQYDVKTLPRVQPGEHPVGQPVTAVRPRINNVPAGFRVRGA